MNGHKMALEKGLCRRPIRWRNGARLGIGFGEGVEADTKRTGAVRLVQDVEGRAAKGGKGCEVVVLIPAGQFAKGFFAEKRR